MRWVTYFPEIHNVHLTKDVGLLPYHMGLLPGVEASLVGRFSKPEYPALDTEVRGLHTVHLEFKGNAAFLDRAFTDYLKEHARQIDILQLYHLSRHTLIYGLYYKRFNPNGKVYLKLDGYNDHFRSRKRYARGVVKNALLKATERRFMRAVDLVSIENTEGVDIVAGTYPMLGEKLFYLPNGANDFYIDRCVEQPAPKEKVMMSVGRPGSPEKNYELLIAALPFLRLDGWRIEVVGPCTPEFLEKWREAQTKFPEQTAGITFVGEITDRKLLYEKYARSSVFFLPSRFESFGISYAEALYAGNVLVGHKGMYAYDDLSGKGVFGTYYPDNDPASFAEALNEAVLLSQKEGIVAYAHACGQSDFAWSGIVERLVQIIGTRG